MLNQDLKLQLYYKDIFDTINTIVDDFECLEIGIEIVKIARDRLDKDLNNESIRKEYDRLNNIIIMLEEIKNNYV